MRAVVVAVILGGCYTPSLTERLPCTPDAHACPGDLQCDLRIDQCVVEIEPPCSAFGAWRPVRKLAANGGAPAVSADGTVLMFVQDVPGRSIDVFYATWDPALEDFTDPRPLDAVNTTVEETDPSWSADGKVLYVRRDGVNVASAVGEGPTFGTAAPATELAGLDSPRRPRFTWDGLDVFYWNDSLHLRHAHRATTSSAWLDRSATLAALDDTMRDEREPAPDAEGLRILYSLDDFALVEAARPDRDSPFGPPRQLDLTNVNHFEPDLSRDGTRLVFAELANGVTALYLTTRTCEAH